MPAPEPTSSPKPLGKFRHPTLPFQKIPAMTVNVRGTSEKFSREGSVIEKLGSDLPTDRAASPGFVTVPAYRIVPVSPTHRAWRARAEATFHAACERAFDHAKLVFNGAPILNPTELPVLVLHIEPYVSMPTEGYLLKSAKPGAIVNTRRPELEFALVRGRPARSFPESDIGPHNVAKGLDRVIRVSLTRAEYERAIADAQTRAMAVGVDLKRALNDFRTADATEGHRAVHAIFGHDLPQQLEETGFHASNPFRYIALEHVKKALLAKTYRALTAQYRDILGKYENEYWRVHSR